MVYDFPRSSMLLISTYCSPIEEQILDALGVVRSPEGAGNVMIQMGYFGIHENLNLLKLNVPIEFSKEALEVTKSMKTNHHEDQDKV